MTDPRDKDSEWSPGEELLVFLNRDIAALSSSSANRRVAAAEVVAEGRYDAVPRLKELLDDDAPVIWDDVIGEVRQAALAALQRLYWAGKRAIDFGPVLVRPAWPLEEMRRASAAAMGGLSPDEREAVLARADEFLKQRVQPLGDEADDIRAYRVLQELGRVPYDKQEIDPTTKLTRLQEELYAQQVASARPRPCLRVALRDSPGTTIGWIYRSPEKRSLAADFSEHPAAVDAQEILSKVLSLGKQGVPRIVHDGAGRPRTTPDGNFQLDGEIALDSDDVTDTLRSVAAFMQREFATELLLP